MKWTFRRSQYKVISENTWLNEDPVYTGTSFESLVVHGWRKNELIFACIHRTANTAAQVSLKFYGRDGKELPNHPVKRLIQKPNSYMSEFDFWSAIITNQKLAGVAYFEKERSRSGQLVALHPLRPDWITPNPGGYEYRPKGGNEKVTLKPEDVVVFPLYDPLGRFNHWPPAAVAARTGDVDNIITDYLKKFMQRGGTPPGILKTVQRLIDDQIDRIRYLWRKRYGGADNWLEPAVLDQDASYQQIGSSIKDMGFETIDARNESRICMVLDVPPILIGAKVGLDRSTFSNYSEARTSWWEDSLVPMYVNFEDVVINQILIEFEPGITCGWDFSRVAALQEDRNSRWNRATEAWNSDGITMNEFRVEIGLPERSDGDVFKSQMATNKTNLQPDSDEKSFKAANPPDDKTRRKHERIVQSAMTEYFEDQLGRIKKEARNNGRS